MKNNQLRVMKFGSNSRGDEFMNAIQRCIECEASVGINEQIYTCRMCGGLLEIVLEKASEPKPNELRAVWRDRLSSHDSRDRSGVWRFRELLPFVTDMEIVTLNEGNTLLYSAPRSASYCGLNSLNLKHQGLNPTGSFKDTGMTVAITQARKLGAKIVVCASTGNTAASVAAYAARADLQCAILVPHGQVSQAKLAQSLDYGARVIAIEGNFDDAMRMISELAADPTVYVVNSINPFRIEGQKTVAAELLEQCDWRVPHHVVVPGGNLGNVTALGKGFLELLSRGLIDRLPCLSVIQAEGAAPFAHLFQKGVPAEGFSATALTPVPHPQTLATAIRIGAPVSWRKAARVVVLTGGRVISVSDQEIADAKAMIGRDGIGCEPASATTVAGIKKLVSDGRISPDENVVAVLTGHLLKDTSYVIDYHGETLSLEEPVSKLRRSIKGNFSNKPVRIGCSLTEILKHLKG